MTRHRCRSPLRMKDERIVWTLKQAGNRTDDTPKSQNSPTQEYVGHRPRVGRAKSMRHKLRREL